jgi:YggT family protein
VAKLLADLLQLYSICIFARIILSWFPITPGGAMATIFSVLWNITEPVLRPLRQVIPPIGMMDLSPLIVFFAIQILRSILLRSG